MNKILKEKIIEVCNSKIKQKGENVGISFYAFFKNKNDTPELLMEAAKWWIEENKFDHFEKAVKIKPLMLYVNMGIILPNIYCDFCACMHVQT